MSLSSKFPHIFLGDRGFLDKYGRKFPDEYIKNHYAKATVGGLGICSGDWRTAELVSSVKTNFHETVHFHHTPFLLNGEMSDQIRSECFSKVYSFVEGKVDPLFFQEDYLVGRMLHQSYRCSLANSASKIEIDVTKLKKEIELINKFRPNLVSIGGDWLDYCIATNSWELIQQIFEIFDMELDYKPFKILYSYIIHLLDRPEKFIKLNNFDALLLPLNLLEEGLANGLESAQNIISKFESIFSVHPLAIGKIPVEPALNYVFGNANANHAIVGASQSNHLDELINYNKKFRA